MKNVLVLVIAFFLFKTQLNAQTINTIAGGGIGGGTDTWGDSMPAATNAIFGNFCGIEFDKKGNLYIGDKDHDIIRQVDAATGIITVVAGNGTSGFNGDNGPATLAQLNSPGWITFDPKGNLYISDRANNRIRKVDTFGIITTFAGNGIPAFAGDNAQADSASLFSPQGICSDIAGNIYIADGSNHRVRKVDTFGIITTIAGTGTVGFSGDGGPAVSAEIMSVYGLSSDGMSGIYTVDMNGDRIRKIDLVSGIITTVAGNGMTGYSGDEGVATSAELNFPFGVYASKKGTIYIADANNHRIRFIDASGIIHTIAGIGIAGYSGDGGSANMAKLNGPAGVTMDSCGNLYIADAQNKRIRKVTFNPTCSPESVASISNGPSISIFPNPAAENITVTGTNAITGISVINVIGQKVMEQNCKSDKVTLNIAGLQSGVYFIKLSDKGGAVITGKFVKE